MKLFRSGLSYISISVPTPRSCQLIRNSSKHVRARERVTRAAPEVSLDPHRVDEMSTIPNFRTWYTVLSQLCGGECDRYIPAEGTVDCLIVILARVSYTLWSID